MAATTGTRIVDRERISAPVAAGLIAGIAGVGVLVNPFSGAAPDPLAAAVALGGAMCWGLGSVYGRHVPHPEQPLLASAVEMLCAGAVLAVLGGLDGEFTRIDLSADVAGSLVAVGYLIVFGSLLAYSAYEWLLRHSGPGRRHVRLRQSGGGRAARLVAAGRAAGWSHGPGRRGHRRCGGADRAARKTRGRLRPSRIAEGSTRSYIRLRERAPIGEHRCSSDRSGRQ
jgi:hypothetical protein